MNDSIETPALSAASQKHARAEYPGGMEGAPMDVVNLTAARPKPTAPSGLLICLLPPPGIILLGARLDFVAILKLGFVGITMSCFEILHLFQLTTTNNKRASYD